MNDDSNNGERRYIWILGLLHSGTTVFWKAWREDKRFLCFDEPLRTAEELNGCYPSNNSKKTLDELITLLEKDPKTFWNLATHSSPLDELDEEINSGQQRFLRYLMQQSSRVVIDETHLHLRISSLPQIAPNAHVIHLYRRARAFVTSHLRPTWSRETTWSRRIVRRLRHEHNKRIFWDRPDLLHGLARHEFIGQDPLNKFGLRLTKAGYDVKRIMEGPAVIRLLAYWHYHYHFLEREGPSCFPEHFKSVRYEDFANNPQTTMSEIYQWLKMVEPNNFQYNFVHGPKPPYQANDRRWIEFARVAGFTEEEIVTLL